MKSGDLLRLSKKARSCNSRLFFDSAGRDAARHVSGETFVVLEKDITWAGAYHNTGKWLKVLRHGGVVSYVRMAHVRRVR